MCGIPHLLETAVLAIKISNNGQDYSTSYATVALLEKPSIHTIAPTHGSLSGGVIVEIQGTNFKNSSVCYFNGTEAYTTVIDSTKIYCRSPPAHAVGDIDVWIGDSHMSVTSNKAFFSYFGNYLMERVEPVHGPEHGGTIVAIIGSNFANTDSLACRFGSSFHSLSKAIYVHSSLIRCIAPANELGTVNIALSFDGTSFKESKNAVFEYRRQIVVAGIEPKFGPVYGGTKVFVSGMYFYNDSHLSCAASGRVFAAAEYINSSMVACRMPVSSASTITLQLSSDGNNFVSVKDTFTYVQKIVVSASKPRRGPVEGGTEITLTALNLGAHSSYVCAYLVLKGAHRTQHAL